jgi:hypothetical protein
MSIVVNFKPLIDDDLRVNDGLDEMRRPVSGGMH